MSEQDEHPDEGLNSIGPAVNLHDDRNRFRQLLPPFRRRSNPEKLKCETDTIVTFQDKTYMLKRGTEFLKDLTTSLSTENKDSIQCKKPKLKPLFAEETHGHSSSHVLKTPYDFSEDDPDNMTLGHKDETTALVDSASDQIEEAEGKADPYLAKASKSGLESREKPCLSTETNSMGQLEFGGPGGVMINMITMPMTVYLLNLACGKESCKVTEWPLLPGSWADFLDFNTLLVYVTWIVTQLILHLALPGCLIPGRPLKGTNAGPLMYKCNGFKAFIVTILGFVMLNSIGKLPITLVTQGIHSLISAAALVSSGLSLFLYYKSLRAPFTELSSTGNSGHPVYDFYMGRELNPRLGPVDLKFFCELRPGLLGWVVLDLCYVLEQWERLGHVELSLLLVVTGHLIYVGDALYFEETVLSTLDITTEGFGFMLAFGDLTWVPFVFSLHARFLAYHPQHWGGWTLLAFAALNGIGYWIFRSSNNQKDKFRLNPDDPKFKGMLTLHTQDGRRLFADGWWGVLRHPNYLGDLIMGLAWTLPCGFCHPLPWFYFLYLSLALFHRSTRDDIRCQHKYGKIWEQYRKVVPSCIIPGLY